MSLINPVDCEMQLGAIRFLNAKNIRAVEIQQLIGTENM